MKQELLLEDSSLVNGLPQQDLKHLYSEHPLLKLKKRLLMDIIGGFLTTAGFIPLLFLFEYWQVYFSLGIVIIFNGLRLFQSLKLYKQTPSLIIRSNSLKEELARHYNSFQKWWSLHLKVILFVGPIGGVAGFIVGRVLTSGKTVDAFFYNFRALTFLAIAGLLVVPICYYGIKWAFNRTYGKYLKKLIDINRQ